MLTPSRYVAGSPHGGRPVAAYPGPDDAPAASALGVAWFPADAEPFTLPR